MNVTDEFAIEGAVRALRNAKRLAQDAVDLYEAGNYGAACILGVIALENIGRGRWMYLFAKNPIDLATRKPKFSKPMDIKVFKKKLQLDHEQTLLEAVTTLQSGALPAQDSLVQDIEKTAAGSIERKRAFERMKTLIEKLFHIKAKDFHKTRTSVQYLEPNDAGTSWNDPQNIDQRPTNNLVVNVANNVMDFASEIMGDALAVEIIEKLNIKKELETAISPPTFLEA